MSSIAFQIEEVVRNLIATIVVLLLTLICVAAMMMAVVTERRKEIGLKKALGADNKSIIFDFLGEGCVLGALGRLLGMGLGFAFAQVVSIEVFGRTIEFLWLIAIFSVLLSIVVTGAASLSSVKIAISVEPAIVLRGRYYMSLLDFGNYTLKVIPFFLSSIAVLVLFFTIRIDGTIVQLSC